ncbi:phosphatase [Raineya orbicola]|jgi:3-deoxy-D-manno-octulosonate 8-phosphate phosphatase (KDO 8-P phosphatase)|uniref:Phosphatase n=1 Tax=Raineya orbicola TaxID=2016530 RepID=A0A2N3IHD0_9BACT|nr:phosphatase [Raineya orbicola]PKQ69716.1 hypothetical protein Rain11_1279 [Raineya orbicola]
MERLLHIQETLEQLGAEFCVSIAELAERASQWNGFLWDWDGVFNTGYKTKEQSSGFNESDSMGINMLRFGYWLKNGRIPFTAIITGEENPTAIHFAQREHFNAICLKFSHKTEALEILQKKYLLDSQKIAFVFDDILDVALAQKVSGRFLVQRNSAPFFVEYAKKHEICDYITASQSGEGAIREICELILSLFDSYHKTISERIAYSSAYQEYLLQRNTLETIVLKK